MTLSDDYLLIEEDMCTGLTNKVIEKIAMERATINEENMLALGVTSRD